MGIKKRRPTLNAQGLARREKRLMSCLEADPGRLFVSVDLGQGEPTCTTHYSKDPNYHAACFGMKGKRPYYNTKGLLMIDDIYLMTASRSPLGATLMREAFHRRWDGKSFADKWLEDPDFIRGELKFTVRVFHKAMCLALGYSQGPKGMCKSARDDGRELSYEEAQKFYVIYWKTYAQVKRLGNALEKLYKKKGFLVNQFGYRLKPDAEYKCLNYFIQSSVSGIMNVLAEKFEKLYPDAEYVTTIHDEHIYSIPKDELSRARAKKMFYKAVDSLNEDLGWDVNITCGWQEGRNLYEAK